MWTRLADGWQIECGELVLVLGSSDDPDRPWRLVAYRTERTLFVRHLQSAAAPDAQKEALIELSAFSRDLQTEIGALTLVTRPRE